MHDSNQNQHQNVTPSMHTMPKLLDPTTIPKFTQPLRIQPRFLPGHTVRNQRTVAKCYYNVDICSFYQQMLPPSFPKTFVYGYGGNCYDPVTNSRGYMCTSPGPTFIVKQNVTTCVSWNNKLFGSYRFPVDPTICWANPLDLPEGTDWPPFPPGVFEAQSPIPTVTHLHGGMLPSIYDGHPDAWFTANGRAGPVYVTSEQEYSNKQQSTMLWYHDHTYGLTRLNVYAGLAGAYIIKESSNPLDRPNNSFLPSQKYEIELIVQDRSFYEDGSLYYPTVGSVPTVHPYWNEASDANTIIVNGRTWPNLEVSQQQYRFKLLNASNGVTFTFALSNGDSFTQITTDGGYVETPNVIQSIMLDPSERADILIDFSCYPLGTEIILLNKTPGVDPETTGQIMKFVVTKTSKRKYKLPKQLNNIPVLTPNRPPFRLTLYSILDDQGTELQLLLDGQTFRNPPSEIVTVGETRVWEFINTTGCSHPIHLHLIQFQILNRQELRIDDYLRDWLDLNGMPPLMQPTKKLPLKPYFLAQPTPPDSTELGWKDTITVPPGQVTRIIVRFAPNNTKVENVQPGMNLFPFDPSDGPGYVWHCHILEHEDNEMMRPLFVVNPNCD